MHKPLNLIIVLSSLLSGSLCMGQNQLVGKWTNSYGSTLEISSQSQGKVQGVYSSSTGSTGKYIMVGSSPYNALGVNANTAQPLSLSILWQPIEGAKGTPDEQWISSMTGQILLDKSGQWPITK